MAGLTNSSRTISPANMQLVEPQTERQFMSLFDSVLGAVSGKSGDQVQANPLIPIIATLLAQSGGLQGLMSKFSQSGLGNVFSSWVSTGPNPPVSGDQIQQVLGPSQLQALAAKLGVDPEQASHMLAEHLPTI